MYASEDNHCASNGDADEEEEETVSHTEDGKGKVVIVLDPVVAAAQDAQGEGEDAHEQAEHHCTIQGGALHQATKCYTRKQNDGHSGSRYKTVKCIIVLCIVLKIF